jgi:ectoine hydroxylase-related dioxygenase (phytanoyl-CoA dioxygenase family)
MDIVKFKEEIEKQGYSIVRNALPKEYIESAKRELEKAIDLEIEYHGKTSYSDFGMVLVCPLYHKVFCELFDIPVVLDCVNSILGSGSITYAYTSSSMPPNKSNYSNRIHRDCPRLIPNYITNLGATILLDDFTEENGATWFLPNSQWSQEQPTPNEFYKNSLRLIESAGTIWFFNANLWHAGGNNETSNWRHALTINMIRPWMKQRLDIPKMISEDGLSETSKQKLGFYSQVPSSYDEYYVPIEKRKYKQKIE